MMTLQLPREMLESCTQLIKARQFSDAYKRTFELVHARSHWQKGQCYRLRHKVYCAEHALEKAWDNDGVIEMDEYDAHSEHYMLKHTETGEIAGTLRVTLPDEEQPEKCLPAQEIFQHPLLQPEGRVLTLCEISRFCMAERFRRRNGDGRFLSSYSEQDPKDEHREGNVSFIRRRIPYAPLALLRGAFETALDARLTECLWMIETSHIVSLQKLGFPYCALTTELDYHEGMVPIVFNIKHVLDHMRTRNQACWEILSDRGRIQEKADLLFRNDWTDTLIS